MSTQTTRSIAQLEALRETTPEADIHHLRENDLELWHWIIDPHTRESRIAREKKQSEAEKRKAQPKATAAVPLLDQYARNRDVFACIAAVLSNFEKVISSDATGNPDGAPVVRAVWKHSRSVRDAIRELINLETARFADAGRVAALTDRVMQLEERLASSEKRAAQHDTAISAHRKHLNNLEIKSNDLKRAMNGQGPSGERIQQ